MTRLSLTDYRNYPSLTWRPAGPITVIFGPNGSGKTNLLEAISLLVPGRGLRGARIGEVPRHGAKSWAVAARFETADGPLSLATGSAPEWPVDRRVFRLDGAVPRTQADILARVSMVWVTPQMDRLFVEPASGRRRFLDRLVHALEPSHAREVAAHDTAMGQRNRLLAAGGADPAWLAGLEDAMARHGVAVTAARLTLARQLNTGQSEAGGFPPARLTVRCGIAGRLVHEPALAVEAWLRDALAANRARDAAAGSAAVGAHRADLALSDAETGLPAALASTGQQKALLIGVVLGHAALLAHARGFAPLLLLDEPTVHLDETRRLALFSALRDGPAQAFLTGVDREIFLPLRGCADAVLTGGDLLRPDPDFTAVSG